MRSTPIRHRSFLAWPALAAAFAALTVCPAARAQDAATPGPAAAAFLVTGGPAVALGSARDGAGPGWHVGAGAEFRVKGPIALRVEGLYWRFGAREIRVPAEQAGGASGTASVRGQVQGWNAFFDLVASRPSADGRWTAYVLAGPLVARRRARIAGQGEGDVDACLPQWFQCPASAVSFDRAIGVRRASSAGASVGLGFSFDVGLTARLVVEARYAYLHGPSFTAADGRQARASASFVPLSVGLRF